MRDGAELSPSKDTVAIVGWLVWLKQSIWLCCQTTSIISTSLSGKKRHLAVANMSICKCAAYCLNDFGLSCVYWMSLCFSWWVCMRILSSRILSWPSAGSFDCVIQQTSSWAVIDTRSHLCVPEWYKAARQTCSFAFVLLFHLRLSKDTCAWNNWSFMWPKSAVMYYGNNVCHCVESVICFVLRSRLCNFPWVVLLKFKW